MKNKFNMAAVFTVVLAFCVSVAKNSEYELATQFLLKKYDIINAWWHEDKVKNAEELNLINVINTNGDLMIDAMIHLNYMADQEDMAALKIDHHKLPNYDPPSKEVIQYLGDGFAKQRTYYVAQLRNSKNALLKSLNKANIIFSNFDPILQEYVEWDNKQIHISKFPAKEYKNWIIKIKSFLNSQVIK